MGPRALETGSTDERRVKRENKVVSGLQRVIKEVIMTVGSCTRFGDGIHVLQVPRVLARVAFSLSGLMCGH